jgi:hypothetical protein
MGSPGRDCNGTELAGLSSLSAAATIDYLSSEKTLLGTTEGVPIVRPEDHVPVEKTMHPAWTESDIRSIIGLFELLERWDSSCNDQSSNLTS